MQIKTQIKCHHTGKTRWMRREIGYLFLEGIQTSQTHFNPRWNLSWGISILHYIHDWQVNLEELWISISSITLLLTLTVMLCVCLPGNMYVVSLFFSLKRKTDESALQLWRIVLIPEMQEYEYSLRNHYTAWCKVYNLLNLLDMYTLSQVLVSLNPTGWNVWNPFINCPCC